MKGVRFYLEFPDNKTKRNSGKNHNGNSGTVLAVWFEETFIERDNICFEALGAIQYYPNAPVGSTSVSWKYLRENCKRISEELAKDIHPNLFHAIDIVTQ